MVQNYLGAAGRNPGFALSYLSPFLKTHPELMQQFFEGSAFGGMDSMIKPMVGGIVTGMGYPAYVAGTAGGQRPLPRIPGGTVQQPPSDIRAAIEAGANKFGMDPYLMLGLASHESGMNPRAVPRDKNGNLLSTARGLFQVLHGTAADMGYTDADMFDPAKSAMAGSEYLAKMYKLFPENDQDRYKHALEAYFLGPKAAPDILTGGRDFLSKQYAGGNTGQTAEEYAKDVLQRGAQYENVPSDVFAPRVNTDRLNYNAGRQAFEAAKVVGGDAGDELVKFTAGVTNATGAMADFIRSLINGTRAVDQGSVMTFSPGTGGPAMGPAGRAFMSQPFIIPSTPPPRTP
jgi:hypothetical protein